MGFLQPNLPDLDLPAWQRGTRQDRMRPMVRHFGEVGFGSPDVVTLVYVVKIGVYVLVGWLLILSTPGIDGFTSFQDWWREPIVFYKAVVWTMLFEVLGLGCGFGPLNLRFTPPLGSFLYWLRPRTIRLPPWPDRVPGTKGDTRTVLDVVLYAGLVGVAGRTPSLGELPRWQVVRRPRDCSPRSGCATRRSSWPRAPRSTRPLAVTYLLVAGDQVVAAKLVMVAIWWGAATSKLNRHFPLRGRRDDEQQPGVDGARRSSGGSTATSPTTCARRASRRSWPHSGTVVEFGVAAAPPARRRGDRHQGRRRGDDLLPPQHHEQRADGRSAGVERLHDPGHPEAVRWPRPARHPDDLVHPLPVIALMAVVVGTVVLGNLFPGKVSFLPAMRYYAGNWDTSMWCFSGAAMAKMDANLVKASLMPHQQLEKVYGDEQVALTMHLGYAFRAMPHPRPGAVRPDRRGRAAPGTRTTSCIDGEMVAGTALGWNFGDGHLHDEQLVAALQKRCHFEPGEVRVVILEAQPSLCRSMRRHAALPARGRGDRASSSAGMSRSRTWWTGSPTDLDIPVVHVTSSATRGPDERWTPSSSAPGPTGSPPRSRSPRRAGR